VVAPVVELDVRRNHRLQVVALEGGAAVHAREDVPGVDVIIL
jgi:hypothetical protein